MNRDKKRKKKKKKRQKRRQKTKEEITFAVRIRKMIDNSFQ